jgi:hypothetical protein
VRRNLRPRYIQPLFRARAPPKALANAGQLKSEKQHVIGKTG